MLLNILCFYKTFTWGATTALHDKDMAMLTLVSSCTVKSNIEMYSLGHYYYK